MSATRTFLRSPARLVLTAGAAVYANAGAPHHLSRCAWWGRGGGDRGMSSVPTETGDACYALGTKIGGDLMQFKDLLSEGEREHLLAGIADKLQERPVRIELDQTVSDSVNRLLSERVGKRKAEAAAASKEFLATAATNPNATQTATGLVVEHLAEGTGAAPTAANTVKVHYHGTLTDGTVFDSSVDRGQPIEFPLGGVIAGWTEGLQLMKVGGKARLTIPSDLAYGDKGAGEKIPGGATLVFEVELLDITK